MPISNVIQAERLKQFLLKIYRCKKDFELLVIDKKPKTRMGCYIVDKQRIRIYITNGFVLRLWRKSQFMNMPTTYMRQRSVKHITDVQKEHMDLNFGEYTRLFAARQLCLDCMMMNLQRILYKIDDTKLGVDTLSVVYRTYRAFLPDTNLIIYQLF